MHDGKAGNPLDRNVTEPGLNSTKDFEARLQLNTLPRDLRITRASMPREKRPQSYYDDIKKKFADERNLRLGYRPEGTQQFTSELTGELAKYERDPYVEEAIEREPINDEVEVLFIGGGFSALLTSALARARCREHPDRRTRRRCRWDLVLEPLSGRRL